MRVEPFSVMILMASTTPGTTSCSRPTYSPSVFSRTMIKSTPGHFDSRPGRFLMGRKLAKRSKVLRSVTLMLLKPPPMGVVTGPFRASLLRSIESYSSLGIYSPLISNASAPAAKRSHSHLIPVASRIRITACVTSGPMPSPGISVTLCLFISVVISFLSSLHILRKLSASIAGEGISCPLGNLPKDRLKELQILHPQEFEAWWPTRLFPRPCRSPQEAQHAALR